MVTIEDATAKQIDQFARFKRSLEVERRDWLDSTASWAVRGTSQIAYAKQSGWMSIPRSERLMSVEVKNLPSTPLLGGGAIPEKILEKVA